MNKNELILELNKICINKEYSLLSAIQEEYPYIYENIKSQAVMHQMTIKKYMEYLGFVRVGIKTQFIDGTFDSYSLKRMYDDYNLNVKILSEALQCVPENIYRQVRNKEISSLNKNGWISNFEEVEIEEILKVIKDRTYYRKDNNTIIIIISEIVMFENKAIIYLKNGKIKCCFELDERIKKALKKEDFDIFTQEDFDIANRLKVEWENQGKILENTKKILNASTSLKNAIKVLSDKKELSVDEYIDLLDYRFIDSRYKVKDEDIIQKIEKYIVYDNTVRIMVKDEDYQFLDMRGSRLYGGIEELINHYGFVFEKGKDSEKIIENYKKLIRERYVVEGNKIYISSMDPIYRNITGIANIRKINKDTMLMEWGFERISNKRLLPKGYVAYDYSQYLKNQLDQNWSEDKIKEILEQISNNKKQVYLDVNTYFYYILFLKKQVNSKTIDEYVLELGYTRVYKKYKGYEEKNIDNLKEIENDKMNYIGDKIKELQNIDIQYREQVTVSNKPERNKKLVKILKELYQCKCQLCGEENTIIPIIEERDGSLYCEVHHINEFNCSYNGNDDIKEIDNYKNTIVLCSFHHAFIHFHHGGYKKLIKHENKVYITNNFGDKIRVITNYHLKMTLENKVAKNKQNYNE